MTDPLVDALRRAGIAPVETDAALADRTTLKVGGAARALVRLDSVADAVAVARISAEQQARCLVVGRGSNLLVSDAGFDGVVIMLGRGLRGVDVIDASSATIDGDPVEVEIGAAEPMPVLAASLEKLGLGGMAFAVAIPGTVGGAVRMNAGAHGSEMADVLVWAEVVRLSTGAVERWSVADLRMRYRHTALPTDALVTRARVRLRRASSDVLAAAMAEMRQWRRDHQPINEPSCGSVFRNPSGDSAGRLIDSAGLKGYRVGGAQVSGKHANFITVDPGATAADVHAVIRHVQHEVERVHGVSLRTEVVMVGFGDVPGAA